MHIELERRILGYLKERAYMGACRIEDIHKMAEDLRMRPGRLQAEIYFLCGEGHILRQGPVFLFLEGS